MTVHFDRYGITVHHGDCLDVLPELDDGSVDAVCTDPPYGLEFMGKEWDAPWKDNGRWSSHDAEWADRPKGGADPFSGRNRPNFQAGPPFQAWCQLWAAECLRVLKPGGHLLAFGGTRTSHRLASAIEDAGFEIRDSIAWLYGSGFPKSLDVSKAIDKAAGAEREVVGSTKYAERNGRPIRSAGGDLGLISDDGWQGGAERLDTAPATDDARRWAGWGTALKPAHEPIVVARKPLAGTVAANVLQYDTGGLNVDGCRVGDEQISQHGRGDSQSNSMAGRNYAEPAGRSWSGRWPANVVLDETQAAALDAQSGELSHGPLDRSRITAENKTYGAAPVERHGIYEADSGGASRFFFVGHAEDPDWKVLSHRFTGNPDEPSACLTCDYPPEASVHGWEGVEIAAERFFYTAKAPTAERARIPKVGATGKVAGPHVKSGRRCNVCGNQTVPKGGKGTACGHDDWSRFETDNKSNDHIAHPTVKPLDLMRWLVRLVTPLGGLVLDPFAGSGTTAEACLLEGFRCVAIERETEYLPLIVHRVNRRRDPIAAHIPDETLPSLFDLEAP